MTFILKAINENRCNVSDEDLDKLSVIHVAGTKGKGSTCAFCEKLLSTKGYCTGLFTSPHLISVKERFKINGKVISDDMFVFYFWNIFNTLLSTKVSSLYLSIKKMIPIPMVENYINL